MNFETFLVDFERVKETHKSFVVVTFVDSKGSVPQEVGARLIVTTDGYFSGTVGGGKVEKACIEKSLEYLRSGFKGSFFHEWNLQKDLGMSCGGAASFFFEIHNLRKVWNVVVFGAGHIAQEFTRLLSRLECKVTCIDSRPEWLEKLQPHPNLEILHVPHMPDYVAKLKPEDFVTVMTMGHGSDLPILIELLKTKEVSYLGCIGSDVKAKRLRKNLVDAGLSEEKAHSFFCPMGEEFGNNTPAEIAISIAAQVLRVRDELTKEVRA